MEIRFSRYSAPFVEAPLAGVHFISLDDQRDMRAGYYSAHVEAYYSSMSSRARFTGRSVIHIFDPLSGVESFHDISDCYLVPPRVLAPEPVLTDDEISLLDDFYYRSGIQAAGRRVKRWM